MFDAANHPSALCSTFSILSGTSIVYKPGVIIGGKVSHDCGTSRAIGYFLEPLIALGPFSKNPMNITLNGITNDNVDISVSTLIEMRRRDDLVQEPDLDSHSDSPRKMKVAMIRRWQRAIVLMAIRKRTVPGHRSGLTEQGFLSTNYLRR